MLGFEPPTEPQARRQWWRRLVELQQQSPLPVAEFCRRRQVKPVTFYAWRRRLQGDSVAAAPAGGLELPPRPNAETGARATGGAAFVPVALVDAGATGRLEIALGDACTIRVQGAVDPRLLRAAIRAAARCGAAVQGGR